MRTSKFISCINSLQIEQEIHSPERLMLTAIIQRAVRDLCVPGMDMEKRKLISWFRYDGPRESPDTGYYFQDLVEILDLSPYCINLIFEYIAHEENTDGQSEEKGEPNRTRNSALATGSWIPFCTQDSTILRRGRYVRRGV